MTLPGGTTWGHYLGALPGDVCHKNTRWLDADAKANQRLRKYSELLRHVRTLNDDLICKNVCMRFLVVCVRWVGEPREYLASVFIYRGWNVRFVGV